MKSSFKDTENVSRCRPKLLACFIIFVMICVPFIYYNSQGLLVYISNSPTQETIISTPVHISQNNITTPSTEEKTSLKHIVFGVGASSDSWQHRKDYIKSWWRPKEMRGFVWVDKPVENNRDKNLLPPIKVSGDTSQFEFTNRNGPRSAIRLSRIVSETFRLGLKDVRWFVMGDDDTFFVADNLVRVLSKYDHNQYYYIGSISETHLQNIEFSYGMAFGGGGFAISYPLTKALERMQDRCLHRYPSLYGSDERIYACMSELGVPLTKEHGFHQYDVHGNPFGLLAAHPITPFVSLHHLDLVDPIFPNMGRVQALQRLKVPMKLDSAGLLQQSIGYDKARSWTVSVSWGYAVQILRGIIPAKEIEIPARTFVNWRIGGDETSFTFNTRPYSSEDTCRNPFVYFLYNAVYDKNRNRTATEYVRLREPNKCGRKMADPSRVDRVVVYKKLDTHLWDKSPRRNCCRILPKKKRGTMFIEVGSCREGEIVELQR